MYKEAQKCKTITETPCLVSKIKVEIAVLLDSTMKLIVNKNSPQKKEMKHYKRWAKDFQKKFQKRFTPIDSMRTIVFNRWVSLAAGVYLMLISGTIYLVPTYANDLKQALQFDAKEMNFIQSMATAGAVGRSEVDFFLFHLAQWISIPGGLFLDKFGYRLTAIVGAIQLYREQRSRKKKRKFSKKKTFSFFPVGYSLLSLCVEKKIVLP